MRNEPSTATEFPMFRTGLLAVTSVFSRWLSRLKPIQLIIAATLALGLSAQGTLAYNFQKSITIDRTKISDGSCGNAR